MQMTSNMAQFSFLRVIHLLICKMSMELKQSGIFPRWSQPRGFFFFFLSFLLMAVLESEPLNCYFFHQCVQCKCWPGFHLKNDGRTCVDIDECSTTLPCSQNCTNTYGSFKCLCVDGYEASRKDPNSCKSLSSMYHLVNSPQNVFSN